MDGANPSSRLLGFPSSAAPPGQGRRMRDYGGGTDWTGRERAGRDWRTAGAHAGLEQARKRGRVTPDWEGGAMTGEKRD
jgi:hypothetical protein